jgi:Arc/MetJ family transcription regulator
MRHGDTGMAIMTKRLVDIDDEALAGAQRLLGTDTIKDTVNTALAEVSQRLKRRTAFADLRKLAAEGGLDLELLADKKTYRR